MSLRGAMRNRYEGTVECFATLKRRLVALRQLSINNPGVWPALDAEIAAITAAGQTIEDALQRMRATRPPLDIQDSQ